MRCTSYANACSSGPRFGASWAAKLTLSATVIMKLHKKRPHSTTGHWYDFLSKFRRNRETYNCATSVDSTRELPDKQLLYQIPWSFSANQGAPIGTEPVPFVEAHNDKATAPTQADEGCATSTRPLQNDDGATTVSVARPDSPTLHMPPLQKYLAIERIRAWNSQVPLPQTVTQNSRQILQQSGDHQRISEDACWAYPADSGMRRDPRRNPDDEVNMVTVKTIENLAAGDSVEYSLHTRPPIVHEHVYPHVHTRYQPMKIRTTHVHEHRLVIQPIVG